MEFTSEQSLETWSRIIEAKAQKIETFLKKDKFKFGDFGQMSSQDIKQYKLEEVIVQEQIDNIENYDHQVKDDPNQL